MITIYDFYTPNCAPCKALEPVLSRVMKQYPGIQVQPINAEDYGDVADGYGVYSVPTLVFLMGDKPMVTLRGSSITEPVLHKTLGQLGAVKA